MSQTRNRRARREFDSDQAQPDRHADRDARHDRDGAHGGIHQCDFASLGRDRRHDDRGPGGRHWRGTNQNRIGEPGRAHREIQPAFENCGGAWRKGAVSRRRGIQARHGRREIVMATRPPVAALVIFDGWGVSKSSASNAIAAAKTPVMNRLYATQAHTELDASGEAVGLPPGVMGNSEVGHLTIGAGRVIYQDVMRISKAIETGAFARNEILLDAIRRARDSARTLHLWGLLSDASVHSHIDHLFALLELAAGEGLRDIAVHAVLDGRDTPPRSALAYVDALEAKLKALGCGK